MSTTELVNVDPKEFGLEPEKALTIGQSFQPKILEREALAAVYANIITKEISKDVCLEASECRKKLVKVRTGIAEVHKTEKAYYLAAGRYVDALKNKLTLPVEQMEEKLSEIEKYYENLEKQRKDELRKVRFEKLSPYMETEPFGLAEMEESVFESLLAGAIKQHEDKIEAERLAEEARIKAEMEAEEERERLRAEAEKAKAEAERIAKELEAEKAKADVERKEAEAKAAKEKAEADRKIKEAQEEAARVQAELKAKADAEAKAEAERIAAEKKALKAPDKTKLMSFASEVEKLANIKIEFKSKDVQAIHANAVGLLNKVVSYINENNSKI